jgi:hypothetical protein
MRPWHTPVIALALAACPQAAPAQPTSLGEPRPAAAIGLPRRDPTPATTPTVRASAPDPLVGDYTPPARLGPISEARLGPPADYPATPEENYNWGIPSTLSPKSRDRAPANHSTGFGGKLGEAANGGSGYNWSSLQSDHCFDDWISPMTNPFLAEDPRSLTELRPIFMYQTIPGSQSIYRGGNMEFFGLQARLAITQRFSIVMNKLGGLSINPGSDSPLSSSTNFTEIWIGPKYTFYRDDQTGTLGAAGAIFQIPVGGSRIYQDTGTLSIAPYVTGGQAFGKTSWGTFHVMDTLGASLGSSSQRSNYVYNSLHLDFDVANWNRIYPLVELNWFHYTSNGRARFTDFEGIDQANVGSAQAGSNFLSFAIGTRYKFSESYQMGIAAEFPLVGNRDLFKFRLGIDFIWRY